MMLSQHQFQIRMQQEVMLTMTSQPLPQQMTMIPMEASAAVMTTMKKAVAEKVVKPATILTSIIKKLTNKKLRHTIRQPVGVFYFIDNAFSALSGF
jgi:hypothetical protein